MDNEIDRLARQVADAADAWLRDPVDAHVYARLVRATLDWRVVARSPVGPAPTPPAAEGAVDLDDDAAVEIDAVPVERRPQRLDMLLGGFADELRARTVTQLTEPTEPTEPAKSAEQPEPTQPV
ncbi:hypothetical protein DDP54_09220 [Cellulomonas sp. WB94]|uniref:hypothetical protein n=1 Tax=Cellulomonas sp. WB94 TaxID=2173174 RepID=UPI000D56A7B1|nr:hypothetical protein [Cellulomonas sp. WB94]PVU83150.1 hypothetical protein DDP54_09220 [Cellulomonas sp. WB94]